MEISQLLTRDAHDEGAEVEILDPTTRKGFKTPVYIKVAGVGSKRFRSAKSRITAESLDIKAAGDEVDTDSQMVKMLAGATIGWRGIERDGEPVEFSVDEAEKLYLGSDFVYDQVFEFLGNRENFTKG